MSGKKDDFINYFKIWILKTVAFLDLLAVCLIVPLIARHVRKLGAGYVYVGLMGSVYSGFQLASGPLLGCLSDIKGRRTVLIFTLLICSVAYTAMGLTNSLFLILLIRIILGLFKQTQILISALVPDYEDNKKKQSEIYGKIAAISGFGITMGPVIGGHLSEEYPEQAFTLVAAIVGVCFVINAGLVFILPKASSNEKEKSTNTAEKTKSNVATTVFQTLLSSGRDSILELFKIEWSVYGTIFLFRGLMEFVTSLHFANYSLYLIKIYGLTPRTIGYAISFHGIMRSISNFCIGYINGYYTSDKDYSMRNFHVFLVLSMSMLGFSCANNIYMYIIFLIPLGIASAVGRLVSLEMLLKKGGSEHRATLIGASNSVRSLSGVIAPITSGIISQLFGIQYNVYVAFLVSALGSFISYYYKNKMTVTVKKD